MKGIPEWLKEARRRSGKSVDTVSEELSNQNIKKSPKTIYGYERGRSMPDAYVLMALCNIYGVEDILADMGYKSGREQKATGGFPTLTPSEQKIGRAYGKAAPPVQRTVEVALEPYIEAPDNIIYMDFTSSELVTCAGNGEFLDDERMTILKVRLDALPKGYERNPGRYFGVPVSGNSMEPRYHDGDMLIVSMEPVNVGEIGVFTLEGMGYVKQLDSGKLHSLNPDYEDIPLTEDVRCNGKVVGILDPGAVKEG